MRFPTTIYMNPVIIPDYYWMKLTDLRTENCGTARPRLWIRLQLGPMHGDLAGLKLSSIIHPTDASIYYYINFINAFRISGMNYIEAIGRWASVEVVHAEYQGTNYSAIKYVHQSPQIRAAAFFIEKAEDRGELDEMTLQPITTQVNNDRAITASAR